MSDSHSSKRRSSYSETSARKDDYHREKDRHKSRHKRDRSDREIEESSKRHRDYNHQDSFSDYRHHKHDNYHRPLRKQPKYSEQYYSYAHSNEQEDQNKDVEVVEPSSLEQKFDSDDDLTPAYEFKWERHRKTLDRIFFGEKDTITRGTPQYDDFWAFIGKFLSFERKKAQKSNPQRSSVGQKGKSPKFELPKRYDKRYRINVSIMVPDLTTLEPETEESGDQDLTRERAMQFRLILLHYLDFVQKQKYAKLVKIRRDQENLPIFRYRDAILKTVAENNVVVVAGDTGCGKSTQVPQYLMHEGYEYIACTQPRRIACISLAKRVGYETLNEFGSEVAYQVRFDKSRTRFTKIVFLTEGLLLRQIGSDPLLEKYKVIVVDEVHERHIHTDFLLGVLKCLVMTRPDVKLILMSATINIDLFSSYFGDCPVIKVPGRLYPIQLEYLPLSPEEQGSKSQRVDPRPFIRVLQTINHKIPDKERGDVLIFLSGMAEIQTVVEAASAYAQHTQKWIVLPLHSALSLAEQDKVFDYPPEGVRKCIVSTNIAETSVTIDGVRFVVDAGKVKEMSFDSKCKMQKLKEFWISRASAEQRKGRAGRTGPGVCYRLYHEVDYDSLPEYSTPEIRRVPLEGLVLQLMNMGLPDARKFPFIEAPEGSSLENAIAFLKDQGAIDDEEKLTAIGTMLAQLPVDVVIGKMLIMGSIFHMIDPVLSIAAALSVQSPLTSRAHTDQDAVNARKPLESVHGDPFTLLNCFDEWVQVKARGQGSRKWCRRRELEEQRFYEMVKLKGQFRELLKEHGLLDGEKETQRYLTANDRRQRHADRQRLKKMRKEKRQEQRKRKMLRMDQDVFEIEREDDADSGLDEESDVMDLEFRLTNDLNQLQEVANETRRFRLRDVQLLKVILCSGLYPQFALADEHNSFKSEQEQAFHTKRKPFVLIHPTSVFATKAELLHLQDKELKEKGGSRKNHPFSSKHELLAFVSLLETTKPYLMGAMRIPSLQTLLLYSNSIDTNANLTRLVFDEWMECCIMEPEAAAETVSSAVLLRSSWHNLLQMKLKEKQLGEENSAEMDELRFRSRRLEHVLASKLTDYLSCDVCYTQRRVMAAEVKVMYRKWTENLPPVLRDLVASSDDLHPTKGGVKLNYYLTYSCLAEVEGESPDGGWAAMERKEWKCQQCGAELLVSVVERIQHEERCLVSTLDEDNSDDNELPLERMDPNKKLYSCPKCDSDFQMSTADILKHRRDCKGVKIEAEEREIQEGGKKQKKLTKLI